MPLREYYMNTVIGRTRGSDHEGLMMNKSESYASLAAQADRFDVIMGVMAPLGWGVGVVGIAVALLGGILLSRSSTYGEREGAGGSTIVTGLCVMVGGPVIGSIASRASGSRGRTDGTDAATAELAPTVNAAPTEMVREIQESAPMDWAPLIWIGCITAALVLAGYATKRIRRRIADHEKTKRTLESDFANAEVVYSDVAAAYAGYLADPQDRYFARPLLDDIDDPYTAAFIDAFVLANDLRPDVCPDGRERVQVFADAAQEARIAWDAAAAHARDVGMGDHGKKGTRAAGRVTAALGRIFNRGVATKEPVAGLAGVGPLFGSPSATPDSLRAQAETAIGVGART
jgi:hypothetical protein